MKIGFLGNANNSPFMIARELRDAGHEVVFIVDSASPLNRPEGRYKDIRPPYPACIVDCSPLAPWQFPREPEQTEEVVRLLKECDALVLNEFGISLWGRIQRPAFLILTGSDVEVLADPRYADVVTGANETSPRAVAWRLLRYG